MTLKPPVAPILSDVCRWCLSCAYGACRRFGHWELRMAEYECELVRWQEAHAQTAAVEKSSPTESRREEFRTRSARLVALPPGVREYLASLGRRGGSSRSERKQAASRRNGQLAGRRHEV